jgi:hypothetical protein
MWVHALQNPVKPVNVLLANLGLKLCVASAKFGSPIPATGLECKDWQNKHKQKTAADAHLSLYPG